MSGGAAARAIKRLALPYPLICMLWTTSFVPTGLLSLSFSLFLKLGSKDWRSPTGGRPVGQPVPAVPARFVRRVDSSSRPNTVELTLRQVTSAFGQRDCQPRRKSPSVLTKGCHHVLLRLASLRSSPSADTSRARARAFSYPPQQPNAPVPERAESGPGLPSQQKTAKKHGRATSSSGPSVLAIVQE